MRSLRGRLLLAGPSLRDPNFFRTVVLMLEHDAEGALGLVLNRPTDYRIASALPPWAGAVSEPDVVFVGGPVAPETALALGRLRAGATEAPGWRRLFDTVGVVDLEATPLATDVLDVRIFAGYAGWAAGQLEAELAQDAWLVLEASEADTTTGDPDTLWSAVLRRQPGSLSWLAAYPDEPAWN
jgi:putative transcriptional regulator